ncbi:aminotransferase class III-fold pyridoxal phosphate-dependent enzyme [Varibaculum cambriense]|uniref:aspartate aminotransferase family protein n=1 Tax=Varibaculum cambriense TaxID=184870 RepID=UPI002912C35C|nr:aminotransferase class III-fold pyridoxal phosphate-dependent enzyme [Varibaculum cambriense]MDU5542312.1 aminotransferase class III-fold pyridoxal phosphate-dependent enzyme [Varibaculum cambriense]
MTNAEWISAYQENLLGVFGQPQACFTHGQGTRVWDADGKEYLDLLGGIAVNALGYAHPEIVKTIGEQASRFTHVSNFFTTPQQVEAAAAVKKICAAGWDSAVQAEITSQARVLFVNSGTEANEAALKMALAARPGGRAIALKGAFHGRTLGSLSLTYKAPYREPFAPFVGPTEFVAATVAGIEAVDPEGVSAIFLEPLQGEAGVIPLAPEVLAAARGLADRAGALLVFDEVQTGMARCGKWLAHQGICHDGKEIVPDVVTLAKGLGAGVPVGACVAMNERAATALKPGSHGTTFGGNPLVSAVVARTINLMEELDLPACAAKVGDAWMQAIADAQIPGIKDARGQGLLRGLVLEKNIAPQLAKELFKSGFIVNAPAANIIRLAPPLIIELEEAKTLIPALKEALAQVELDLGKGE